MNFPVSTNPDDRAVAGLLDRPAAPGGKAHKRNHKTLHNSETKNELHNIAQQLWRCIQQSSMTSRWKHLRVVDSVQMGSDFTNACLGQVEAPSNREIRTEIRQQLLKTLHNLRPQPDECYVLDTTHGQVK